jgi:hypothetical protein
MTIFSTGSLGTKLSISVIGITNAKKSNFVPVVDFQNLPIKEKNFRKIYQTKI